MCFEDESPPPAPTYVAPPPPPSAQQLSRESIQTAIEAAPQILALNREQLPQYAQLQTDIARTQAPQQAQLNLEQQQLYGPQLIDVAKANIQRADPTGFGVREDLGARTAAQLSQGYQVDPAQIAAGLENARLADPTAFQTRETLGANALAKLQQGYQIDPAQIQAGLTNAELADPSGFALKKAAQQKALSELALGGELSPDELRLAQEDIRAGQVARGGGTGLGDTMQEALRMNINRFGRQQQRQAGALSTIAAGPLTNMNTNPFSMEEQRQAGALQALSAGPLAPGLNINPFSIEQQRLGNAASFISGQQPIPQASSLSSGGSPQSPNVGSFAQIAPSTSQLMGLGMQSAGMGAQNAQFQNSLNNNQWQYIDQNTSNPFLTGLAGAAGTAVSIFGAMSPGGAGPAANFGSNLMSASGGVNSFH